MRQFSRIDRLPPYVFDIVGQLKLQARQRGIRIPPSALYTDPTTDQSPETINSFVS